MYILSECKLERGRRFPILVHTYSALICEIYYFLLDARHRQVLDCRSASREAVVLGLKGGGPYRKFLLTRMFP